MSDLLPSVSHIKALVIRKFKSFRLSLRPDANDLIIRHIHDRITEFHEKFPFSEDYFDEINQQLDILVEAVQHCIKDRSTSSFITADDIKGALHIISQIVDQRSLDVGTNTEDDGTDRVQQAVQAAALEKINHTYIISAFTQPIYQYNIGRGGFVLDHRKQTIHSTAPYKIRMLQDRYRFIYERLCRIVEKSTNASTAIAAQSSNRGISAQSKTPSSIDGLKPLEKLYQIDILEGSSGDLTVFGMLSEVDGVIVLESPDGTIQCDLSESLFLPPQPQFGALVAPPTGRNDTDEYYTTLLNLAIDEGHPLRNLFTFGSFLVVSGRVECGGFRAILTQLPLSEPGSTTRSLYPILTIPTKTVEPATYLKQQAMLETALTSNPNNHRIIVLGEVHLHDTATLEKLDTLLTAFNHDPPNMIVIMGNFMSIPHQRKIQDFSIVRQYFDNLADVIQKSNNIAANTHFVICPGSRDIFFGSILPVPPLLDTITGRLKKVVKNITFTSNPTCITYYHRYLRFFRGDLYDGLNTADPSVISRSVIQVDDITKRKYDILQKRRQRLQPRKKQPLDDDMMSDDDEEEMSGVTTLTPHGEDDQDAFDSIVNDQNHDSHSQTAENTPDDGTAAAALETVAHIATKRGELVATFIASQSTVLHDYSRPVMWDYSQSLDLMALPDVLFLSENSPQYNVSQTGTQFVNISVFTGQWSFVMYYPSTNQVEFSEINF